MFTQGVGSELSAMCVFIIVMVSIINCTVTTLIYNPPVTCDNHDHTRQSVCVHVYSLHVYCLNCICM